MGANSIQLAANFSKVIGEYSNTKLKSAVLDSPSNIQREAAGANQFNIPVVKTEGLGEYSKTTGMPSGGGTLEYQTVTANFNRGRAFTVDALDIEESALTIPILAKKFQDDRVIPELDAFRFATYASKAGVSASPAVLSTGADALEAIVTGTSSLDNNNVNETGRYLFVESALYNMIMNVDTYKSKAILERFDEVIPVPATRFYTSIKQLSGKDTEATGGFTKNSSGGVGINFLIVNKDAVVQFTKHIFSTPIEPKYNPNADAWVYKYHIYSIADVITDANKGIYLHASTT